MVRTKQAMSSSSSGSERVEESSSPTPPTSPINKRVSKPTTKVLAKDKGKEKMVEEPRKNKRKEPSTDKLLKDAMKSSSSAPKTKKSKKVSLPTSPDEDLPVLIPDEEARATYILEFASRKIHPARIMDFAWFDKNGFTFQDHLRFYGMIPFLTSKVDYYPRLIRVFYSNFKLFKTGFSSMVKGKPIVMTFAEVGTLLELPFYGKNVDGRVTDDATEGVWEAQVDYTTAVQEIMIEGFRETTSLPAGKMKVQHRMLLYVISKFLLPRTGNFAVVQALDITLLWGLIKDLPISWAWLIVQNMSDARKTVMLPYPQVITKILRKFKISVAGEDKGPPCRIVGEATINQMQLKRVGDDWIYATAAGPDVNAQIEPNAIMANLLEIANSQAELIAKHDAEMINMANRLGRIEDYVSAIHKHLFALNVSFNDVADIGQQAVQYADIGTSGDAQTAADDDMEQVDQAAKASEPHGEETPAEVNTAVSHSTLGDNEGQNQF
ncbi:hypothetical protein OROGR_000665 [Orobanche gracilis]